MARGRMLNQSIAMDAEFNNMSMEAQFLYMRTIPHLDRDGLILGNAVALWARVAPLMPDMMPKMQTAIEQWITADLVISYETKQGTVLFFRGFTKNQTGLRYEREAESMFTPPPGYCRGKDGLIQIDQDDSPTPPPAQSEKPDGGSPQKKADTHQQDSGNSPATVRQQSGVNPAEVEVKLKEVEANTHAREASPEHRKSAAATTAEPPVPKATKFIREYERVWCLMPSQYHSEKIAEWAERVTFEGWTYALQECANTRNVGKWKYFESILSRVEVEGIGKPLAPAAAKVPVNGNVNISLASV